MKCVVLFTLFIGICGSQQYDRDYTPKFNDEAGIQKISETIERIGKNANSMEEKIPFHFFRDSVDKTCMLNKYKDRNITDKLMSDSFVNDGATQFIFYDTAIICSTHADALAESAFNVIMSPHILVQALINDSKYSKYTDMLTCANGYAVENNILDASVYDINHQVLEKNQEACDDLLEEKNQFTLTLATKVREAFERPCVLRVYQELEKLLIRTVLLVQVELSEEQKQNEKLDFIKKLRKLLDNFLVCLMQRKRKNG